jgi:hypothetical protein
MQRTSIYQTETNGGSFVLKVIFFWLSGCIKFQTGSVPVMPISHDLCVHTVSSKDIRDARRFAKKAKTQDRKKIARNLEICCIEHPIHFQIFNVSFDKCNPLRSFMIARGLYCSQVQHWISWNGYHAESIANMLNSVPPILCTAVEEAVRTVHSIKQLSAQDFRCSKLTPAHGIDNNDAFAIEVTNRLLNEAEELWEIDCEWGYQVITLDPVRQVRRDHRINSKLASMFGMHREEMLARLANHDLPIYFIEVDAMSMFVLMILKHPAPGRRVKYFRMCTGSGRFRTVILVAQYTVTIADDQGRIVQV